MSSWTEYKQIAQSRGALALELYVVISTPAVDPSEMGETLPAHLEYQKQMEEQGSLVLAGPLSDETGEAMSGAGLIIYRATTFEAARALADADPMHRDGKRNYKLRRWLINEGFLNISLSLSKQRVSFL